MLSGVPTAGIGLPVLYWRINAGAYTGATATSLGGGQYQFTFGAGVVVSDMVSYYVVAQDTRHADAQRWLRILRQAHPALPLILQPPRPRRQRQTAIRFIASITGSFKVGTGRQPTTL